MKGIEALSKDTIYTKSCAARILMCSRPTIDRMIKDGRLKKIEIEGNVLVKRYEKS